MIAELRPKLAEIPGIRSFMVNQPPINLGGRRRRIARCISSRCRTPTPPSCTSGRRCSNPRSGRRPGFEDVNSDLQLNNPQVTVEMNRDKLVDARFDCHAGRERALQRLRHAAGLQIYAPNNQYQVILRVAPQFQRDPGAMSTALHPREQRPADSARVGRANED